MPSNPAWQDWEKLRETLLLGLFARYSAVLHESVQSDRPKRQDRALQELWKYLYPIALYKTEDEVWAQDVAQRALIAAWRERARCRDRGRFLAYAKRILVNEILMDIRRARRHPLEPWPEPDENGREDALEQRLRSRSGEVLWARPVEIEVLDEETIECIRRALAAALPSERRYRVIVGFFVEGRGFKEIAEELDTKPSNVHTLKFRALAQLRGDEEFHRRFRDCLGM